MPKLNLVNSHAFGSATNLFEWPKLWMGLTFFRVVASNQKVVGAYVVLLVDFDDPWSFIIIIINKNSGRIEFAGVRSLLNEGQTEWPIVLYKVDLQLLLAGIQNEADAIAILDYITELVHIGIWRNRRNIIGTSTKVACKECFCSIQSKLKK